MNKRIAEWYLQNIRALQKIYGNVSFEGEAFKWVLIHKYILPDCFNQNNTALLITTPREDLMVMDGFDFYLNKRLQRIDGRPTGRLHDNGGYNPYSYKGYSRLSFHVFDFRPYSDAKKGDNFISICEALYNFLGDERGVI
jgi:hypothetical protein